MKLGLLVVVAVAVLLPSFTESRIVSKCELKDKLANVIRLPRGLKESVLPIIVCELERISHLNTSLVNVFGKRITTTLKPTVVTTPSTTAVTLTTTGGTTLTSTNSATTDLTKTTTTATATTATSTTSTATTTAAATSTATTAAATSAAATTAAATSAAATTAAATSAAATSTATTTAATSTAATSTATTTTTVMTTSPAITSSTSTSGMKRRKRHAHSSSEEEIGQIGGKMDDSSEEDSKENTKPLSLGLYGLFQLSDSLFCNSGLRPSRNICRTSCNSFTDNNIADDIACFINTGYWKNIVQRASRSCRLTSNLFRECK